ncbi:MAG: twin-arginine translocase TatA/TatE family subunit [Sphingobium sp.]|jgi:sec-independent protein translocase protein TatA
MGFGSPLHWIVLVLVVVLLFGGGRISSVMGDVAKGIKSFKKGMADDDDDVPAPRQAQPVQQIEARAEQAPQTIAAEPVHTEQKQG